MSRLKKALRRDAEAFIPVKAKPKKPPVHVGRRLVACLCSLVLFVSAAAVLIPQFTKPQNPNYANCYFSIDINPSIEFLTGDDGRVEKVSPKNKYAISLLEGQSLLDKSADEVLVSILQLAENAGYLDRTAKNNAVLINVLSEDSAEEVRIAGRMKSDAQNFFKREYIFGVVLTSASRKTEDAEAAALSISPAKLELVNEIIKFDRTKTLTKESLAAKPVKELNQLLVDSKRGYIVLDDDDFDDFYDSLLETQEEIAEFLEEFSEELSELLEEESDPAEVISAVNEWISELNAENNLSVSLLPDAIALKDIEKTVKDELNDLLKRGEEELKVRLEEYKSVITTQSNQLESYYVTALKNFDMEKHVKEFKKDYEEWLEEAGERWEDDWDGMKAAWENEKLGERD